MVFAICKCIDQLGHRLTLQARLQLTSWLTDLIRKAVRREISGLASMVSRAARYKQARVKLVHGYHKSLCFCHKLLNPVCLPAL